jgi:Ca-activated chloride channel family protein
MTITRKYFWYAAITFFFCCLNARAQEPQRKETPMVTRILFLFDASQSMFGRWQSGMKIDIAKKLLNDLVDSLKSTSNLELALRAYGHQKQYPPQDCDDTRLEVPFTKNNHNKIKESLSLLTPRGTTPIARSLEACGNDFPSGPARNIIILITDGIEECSGDPCAVSAMLQKNGVVLKPFVIGMGLDSSLLKKFDCIGTYFDASNENTFKNVLKIVVTQALNPTTVQVNLLDVYNRATETNVNMTFYDRVSGKIKYNFYHTMNEKGIPDTLRIDPLTSYRVVVQTIPTVEKDSVTITGGKHNTIAIPSPQGNLHLKFEGISDYKKLPCIVRKAGEMKTLHVQEFNTTEKYLVGKYDLEILSLPRINYYNVPISQDSTTGFQVPQPGIATILSKTPGYASIYLEEKNSLRWIYNLDPNNTKESIVLLPGNYRVVYRPRAAKQSFYTVEKSFKIISGGSVAVQLY